MKSERSFPRAYGAFFCLFLAMVLLQACQKPALTKFIEVPKNVVAVLGEAEAFETSSTIDSSTETALDIQPILDKVKNVEGIDLLAWDKGDVFTPVEASKKGGTYYAKLKPATRYLVLGIVDQRARDTYRFTCQLLNLKRAGGFDRVPEICKRILCSNEAVRTDELLGRYPELGKDNILSSMKGKTIGGWGGNCDTCTDTQGPVDVPIITPGHDCLSVPTTGFGAQFVFARKQGSGSFQIFKSANGMESNLSNNAFSDEFPDVANTGGKIAFTSTGRGQNLNGLHTMNLDGSQQTQVHASSKSLSRPRWAGERVIAFTEVSSRSKLFVMDVLGQLFPLKQFTFPGSRQNDNFGHDFLPGHKDVVFSRSDQGENDFILFSVNFSNASASSPALPPLTQTPQISEEFPAVSHDETMLAFRELIFGTNDPLQPTSEQVKVIRIPASGIPDFSQVLFQVSLSAPAIMGITGLDFTADDKGLLVSTATSGIQATVERGNQEIYFIKLDGTGQQRLTNNAVEDTDPRAIPQ